jgi:hypothetical protein
MGLKKSFFRMGICKACLLSKKQTRRQEERFSVSLCLTVSSFAAAAAKPTLIDRAHVVVVEKNEKRIKNNQRHISYVEL